MCGLDSGQDALHPSQILECLHRLGIGHRQVGRAINISQVRVLWPHARVIQTGGNRVGLRNLAILVLHQGGEGALEHTRITGGRNRCCMATGLNTVTASFSANQANRFIIDEVVERADRIRTAADTGHDSVGKRAGFREDLLACLGADDALEVAHHCWERVRTGCSAEAVVGVIGV